MLFFLVLLSCLKYGNLNHITKVQLPTKELSGEKINDIIKLLDSGKDLNQEDEEGTTLLCRASMRGDKELVEFLLANGAAIDLAQKDGLTPIYIASQEGHKEVVELLLTKGAAIDLANIAGFTPLYAASYIGHKEVVELLLEKGAAIDLADKNGLTPLYAASWKGHKEVVELLIAKGASIDLSTKDLHTPLYVSSYMGHKEVAELLIAKGAAIDSKSHDNSTSLYIASKHGHKEIVELLLINGASTDLANKDRETPLYIASEKENKEIVELLLRYGASTDLANKNGYTPIYIASYMGNCEIVDLLLMHGAAKDSENNKGDTPLSIASSRGNSAVVELLLTSGATINLSNKNGETSLYMATRYGHKKVVELLLRNRASIDLVNRDGYTPLYFAYLIERKEIVLLLLKNGADISKSFGIFTRSNFINRTLEYALSNNDIDSCFKSKLLLHVSNIATYINLSRYLSLSYMISEFHSIPNLNYYNYNSLHFSIFEDNTDNLRSLLSDPNIWAFINLSDNRENITCLALAIKLNKFEHAKVLLSFLSSRFYNVFYLYGFVKTQMNALDTPVLREYISNQVVFDALRDGRIEHATRLLSEYAESDLNLDLMANGFGYINLEATSDEERDDNGFKNEKKNVFHFLAKYGNKSNELEIENFFNESFKLPSFSNELLFAYDLFGMTPFHYAVINSNTNFIKYLLVNNFDSKDVMKDKEDGEDVKSFLTKITMSQDMIDLLANWVK